jgi:three-Cys-motif partner protein
MGVPDETVWEIEPHTQAKHELLTRYLNAWFPILGSWNTKVFYIDGFAGPGTYKAGEPGSPLLAIDAARQQQRFLKDSKVLFLFNESEKERHDELRGRIDQIEDDLPDTFDLYLEHGEFVDLAQKLVDDRGNRSFVPTFAFIDPFGWKGVPLNLIANLVRDKRSELFILFSYNSLNRWLTHKHQQENMRSLFGCDDYLRAVGMRPTDRKKFLAGLYEQQLRYAGKFEYISRFEMIEKTGRTSYFLYHCTRNIKGLAVMRSAMWKIDPLRGCQFSDKVAGLESMFEGPLTFDLEDRIMAAFSGQLVPIEKLEEFVLIGSPFAPEHLKKVTLKPMQHAGLITEVVGQKARGTFPKGVQVRFA